MTLAIEADSIEQYSHDKNFFAKVLKIGERAVS